MTRPFAAWGLAGLLLHLSDPCLPLDPGFQLSFAAVLGLGAAGCLRTKGGESPGAPRWRAWIHGAGSLAAQGLGAEAGTAALQARMFGALPVVGIGLNLAIVPLCSLFMAESVLFLAAQATPVPWLGGAAAGGLEATGDLLLAVNAWGSGLLRPWIAPRPPSIVAAAIAAIALLLAWGRAEAGRGGRVLGSAAPWGWAALAIAFEAAWLGAPRARPPEAGTMTMVALDVGQGDATWIGLPGGSSVLVDAGPADENRDAGAWAVEPALRAERATRPVTAILSHAHLDHYGGLGWLAERGWIGTLYENGSDGTGAWRRRIRAGVARSGGRVASVAGDSTVRLGGGASLELRRAAPETAAAALHENDRSLAATIRLGRTSALLAGDLEAAGEEAVLDRLGPVDVLKAPHHGSGTSSTPAWVARLTPRIVTISVGEHNRFGHPDRAVVGRYERAGALVLRTDREGAIRITVTPVGGWISTRAHPEPVFVSWSRGGRDAPRGPGH